MMDAELPVEIYRRFLMLTCTWEGTRATTNSLIIKTHSGGDQPALFWCGGPDDVPMFAEVLGDKRSIFCMRGTYGVLTPTEDVVKALARYYADEIVNIQPQGPYLLGGHCEAGLIAFEIAQVLTARGYSIGMLVLVERDSTEQNFLHSSARMIFSLIDRTVFLWDQRRQFQIDKSWKDKKKHMKAHLKKIGLYISSKIYTANGGQQMNSLIGTVGEKNKPPKETLYSIKPYPGKVVLIYIRWGVFGFFQFKIFQKFWKKIALGGADIRMVPWYTHTPADWTAAVEIVRTLIEDKENQNSK